MGSPQDRTWLRQVPTCTGDLTCHNLVHTFNPLEWLSYQLGNRHNRQVTCRLRRVHMLCLPTDNRQGPQHLLRCPTLFMGILVILHLELVHILDLRKQWGLNCLH